MTPWVSSVSLIPQVGSWSIHLRPCIFSDQAFPVKISFPAASVVFLWLWRLALSSSCISKCFLISLACSLFQNVLFYIHILVKFPLSFATHVETCNSISTLSFVRLVVWPKMLFALHSCLCAVSAYVCPCYRIWRTRQASPELDLVSQFCPNLLFNWFNSLLSQWSCAIGQHASGILNNGCSGKPDRRASSWWEDLRHTIPIQHQRKVWLSLHNCIISCERRVLMPPHSSKA